jgi:predicted ABC-type ATPase
MVVVRVYEQQREARVAYPHIIVLAGPNGAGKTTAARGVLQDLVGVGEFVNADAIAAGLSGFAPDRAAFAAGRIMLERLRELAASRATFAFETTMASRTFAPWLSGLRASGYRVHIAFLWLASPALATRRVALRVRHGGHHVPPDVIRRRYAAGIANFHSLYRPLADAWIVYDNSAFSAPRIVASGPPIIIHDKVVWSRIERCQAKQGE